MTEPVLAGKKLAVLDEILGLSGRCGGTALEVACLMSGHTQQSVVASRCTQLARMGLIEDSGYRRRGLTSRLLIVWAITEKGREALRRAEEVSR